MNNFFYSPSTRGFYCTDIHGTNMPEDVVALTDEQYNSLIAEQSEGKVIAPGQDGFPVAAFPEVTREQRWKMGEAAIQNLLDEGAKAKGYDNIMTAISYGALPPGTPFQAEGQAYGIWRAHCWATAYGILQEITAGEREEPTLEELLAAMPALDLPS